MNKLKKIHLSHLLISILILAVVGCSKVTPITTPEEISNSLIIEYQTGPEIQTYDYVQALVKNTTSYCIVFPSDFGIRLVLDKDTNETEIENYTKYLGNQPVFLEKNGDSDFISVGFDPDVSKLTIDAPTTFFAEITGHLCDDDSVIIKKKIPFVVVP